MKIAATSAYQIFDSRGNPTVEVIVTLDDGTSGVGRVPSGASTGQYEALELRDDNPARFRGKSVFGAIENVNTVLAAAVRGRDVYDQDGLDQALIEADGTPDKSRLGANALLGVSLAAVDAAARARGTPVYDYLGAGEGTLLPLPEIQIVGGGAHANWRTDVQDFMLVAIGAQSYAEALEITFNVYHAAGDLLVRQGRRYGLADEGGYWPEFASNSEVFEVCLEAIELAGYTPGVEAALSLDIAASDLYDPATGIYRFRSENRSFDSDDFAGLMIEWCERYPIVSIEDPMADSDWDGWVRVREAIGARVQLIGDDLFTTNLSRIQQGIERNIANAVLIKLNQIGTVSETLEAVRATRAAGWRAVISARSGETEDAFIAHLAVATNAGQLKVGSFARSERMVKWNEVLRIARHLGLRARFIGGAILKH